MNKTKAMQIFTYNSETNCVANIYKTYKPAIITMVIYEVEK